MGLNRKKQSLDRAQSDFLGPQESVAKLRVYQRAQCSHSKSSAPVLPEGACSLTVSGRGEIQSRVGSRTIQ